MRILARISLLSAEQGGRTQPFIGSFWPNHSFAPGMFVIGQVKQDPTSSLFPGDTADLLVDFIPDGLPALGPGMEWSLYDGPSHLIGSATVLKINGG